MAEPNGKCNITKLNRRNLSYILNPDLEVIRLCADCRFIESWHFCTYTITLLLA